MLITSLMLRTRLSAEDVFMTVSMLENVVLVDMIKGHRNGLKMKSPDKVHFYRTSLASLVAVSS